MSGPGPSRPGRPGRPAAKPLSSPVPAGRPPPDGAGTGSGPGGSPPPRRGSHRGRRRVSHPEHRYQSGQHEREHREGDADGGKHPRVRERKTSGPLRLTVRPQTDIAAERPRRDADGSRIPVSLNLANRSGGSVGREGPIVQIGSALASGLGQWVRIPENRLRVLVACGGTEAEGRPPAAGRHPGVGAARQTAAPARPGHHPGTGRSRQPAAPRAAGLTVPGPG